MEPSNALQSTIQQLHSEVHIAETIIKNAVDTTWHKVASLLQERAAEFEMNCSSLNSEVAVLSDKVTALERQNADLQHSSTKLMAELETYKKRERDLCQELESTKSQFKQADTHLKAMKSNLTATESNHAAEVVSLQTKLTEQSCLLKEYQERVTTTTNKMQRLSQQLTTEKSTNEKIKTTYSTQVSQQSTEFKKMTLELSKLKGQVASSNKAQLAAKSEAKRLQEELRKSKEASESAITVLHQEHLCTIKELREKVVLLEREIEQLKSKHFIEIQQLKQQHSNHEDTFMDARIAFLQHQNRQEKVKIDQDGRTKMNIT